MPPARLPPLARPVWDINHVLAYGQSLSTGWEGWPALSRQPRHDSLMLGHSVRPLHENQPRFIPVGGPVLRPLAATVQRQEDGALLTPAEAEALPETAVTLGETVLEGALAFWRARMLADGAQPGRHRLLASACGVGGRGLEALMPGAEPELFNRLRECVGTARAAAQAAGLGYGVTALLMLQGEFNNRAINNATDDEAEYGALLRRCHAAMLADAAQGQTPPPALFRYQTGGAYAADAMAVPMAQLAMAREVPGVFLAAPVYPVTDKGGHLDANGYRWLGQQFGKVMHLVLDRGLAWQPLHPLAARLAEGAVILDFHVPVPPLRFGAAYQGHRGVMFPDRGFLVADSVGELPVTAVTIESATQLRLSLGRPPGPGLFVRYAGQTRHGGVGNLYDSDPTLAEDRYETGPGHRPGAAIAELAGRPYPLMNWCVAFRMPVPGA